MLFLVQAYCFRLFVCIGHFQNYFINFIPCVPSQLKCVDMTWYHANLTLIGHIYLTQFLVSDFAVGPLMGECKACLVMMLSCVQRWPVRIRLP